MARRNNLQGKMTEAEFKRDYARRPEYYNNIARQKGWLGGNEPVEGPIGKVYCLLCCFMASCCDCTKCSCPTETVRRKGGITKSKRKMARGGAMRKKVGPPPGKSRNGGRDWCMDPMACNFDDWGDCFYPETSWCETHSDGWNQDILLPFQVCCSHIEGNNMSDCFSYIHPSELNCNWWQGNNYENCDPPWTHPEYWENWEPCPQGWWPSNNEWGDWGCTHPDACNYDPFADACPPNQPDCCHFQQTIHCYFDGDNDGFYEDVMTIYVCEGEDCSQLGPGWMHSPGLGQETGGCTDPSACNYNPPATEDNGTCYYETTVQCFLDQDQDGYWEMEQTLTACDATCSQLGPNWTEDAGMGHEPLDHMWFCNSIVTGGPGGEWSAWCEKSTPGTQQHEFCLNNPQDCFWDEQSCWNSGCGDTQPPPPGPEPHELRKKRLPNIIRRKGGKVNRTMKVTRKRR